MTRDEVAELLDELVVFLHRQKALPTLDPGGLSLTIRLKGKKDLVVGFGIPDAWKKSDGNEADRRELCVHVFNVLSGLPVHLARYWAEEIRENESLRSELERVKGYWKEASDRLFAAEYAAANGGKKPTLLGEPNAKLVKGGKAVEKARKEVRAKDGEIPF